jgi:hypothetical protein
VETVDKFDRRSKQRKLSRAKQAKRAPAQNSGKKDRDNGKSAAR